jgi:uncharacterized protein
LLESVNLVGAMLLGLMGAGHCLAMCGGIISTLSISSNGHQAGTNWLLVLVYQLGRISSYTLFGLFAGWLGLQFKLLSSLPILQIISSILLIAMGLYISRIWMGLSYLEKLGKKLWNLISPLAKHFLPVVSPRQAFALGCLWGWLPCGLVYTSLGYALSLGNSIQSALFMLIFGLGTLPATLLAGSTSLGLKQFLNNKTVRTIVAIGFILFSIYTLVTLFSSPTHLHHH